MNSCVQVSKEERFISVLIPLIEDFIEGAGEVERSTGSIVRQIQLALQHGCGGLWVIWDGIDPIGYAFADVIRTEYDTKVALVHQLYIKPQFSKEKLVRRIDAEIGLWGKAIGASEMAFFTRRKAKAFQKILLKDWVQDSVVFKRPL